MGNAPERIFAWVYEEGSRRHHVWRGKVGPGGEGQTEYIRADLARPKVKPLVWHMSHMPSWNDDWHTVPTGYSIRCADEWGWKWQSPLGAFGHSNTPTGAQAAAQADYEARILAALELAPAPRWQPIETAPSDHLLFHGNTRHDARVVFTGWKAVNGICYADTGDSVKPTHWMPLPAPPEAD